MPWEAKDVLTMKEEVIQKALSNQVSISDLAVEYRISRQTIYKWIKRFKEQGIDGLMELSRRPHSSPNRTTSGNTELILNIHDEYSAWGGRKLRQRLINKGHKIDDIPSESTFNRVLKKHGRIDPDESKKRQQFIRFEKEKPNELWQMDFKGHFKMGTKRCHPLTVLDDHSRFSIVLKACLGETYDVVYQGLESAFEEYGLPDGMTMDNGSPWKGSPPWTLSRLTVWLMRLGIKVSHSSVRHPQTQGKDERFHRSLKDEVIKFHQFKNLKQTQELFDDWKKIYNYERPHEGIGLLCPYQRYKPSSRSYTKQLPKVEYDAGDVVRKVQANGTINYSNVVYFVGEHLRGEYIALRPTSKDGVVSIYFVKTKIGTLDLTTKSKRQRSK
jgi:transposase InsO family protein